MKVLRQPVSRLWPILLFVVLLGRATVAQQLYQRTFSKNVSDVQRAVDELREASSGRLPTLEGFVEPGDQPIDRYERGFYECTFQVTATPAGGAVVQASAKITAWYKDPLPARSGYRVLVSNGRVENDLLDQIAETLGPNSTVSPSAAPGTLPPRNTSSGGLHPQFNTDPAASTGSTDSTEGESSSRKGAGSGPLIPLRPPASTLAPAASTGESIASMKARRAADEKQTQDLTAEIKALEDVLHNQVRPTDLAAVKKGGAPIYSKASENSPVLLTASAEDEFQIIETEGGWVHVQISGASRGWIRRNHLDLPADFAQAGAKPAESSPTGDELFKVSRQETNSFGGNWEPLKGKTVKVIWVEPASPTASTSPAQKLAFAKPLLVKAYAEVNSATPAVYGVVIVFDSADGGQIAATLSSLKQMADGDLPEAAFWKQCSLDPPESFQESAKPSGKQ
ncbi:MAG: SH3 domain-containing protein [Candidatus Acidiferrales bacterium]